MKFLLIALLGLSTSSAFALETIKVLDGKAAYCKTKHDQYRARLGAYSLKANSISVDDEKISIATELKFLKCVNSGDNYAWEESSAMAEHEFQLPAADGVSTHITVVSNMAELRAFRDGVYQIIATVDLSDKALNTDIELALGDFLSLEEMDRLSNGETLKLDIDAFLLKNISFLGLEEEIRLNRNFGTFRIRFELKQSDDGTLNAKRL